MKIVREQAEIEKLLRRSQLNKDAVNQTVKSIIADVRAHGDSALSAYTEKFDRYAGALTVTPE